MVGNASSNRLLLVIVALVASVLIPFAIWGDALENLFMAEGSFTWFQEFGRWAWLIAILMLMLDIFLPMPGTAIVTATGLLYGALWGTLIAFSGCMLSGLLGYAICRAFGRRGALWLLGKRGLEKAETTFLNTGGWIVALSRWLPVFSEVVSCMAGLSRMPPRYFVTALACGSFPFALSFVLLGTAGVDHPMIAIIGSIVIPPVLWSVVYPLFRRSMQNEVVTEENSGQ
jgi:uncharacterized membrane protein YdjX (TVP38/TMEM64 family)